MELKRVLIIEDIETDRSKVFEEFKAHEVAVLQVGGYEELEQCLATHPDFQMVILDWLLDGETSVLARLCLKKIRQAYFVPVLVWTGQLERFEDEVDIVKEEFPEACLRAASKAKVGFEDLLTYLNKWYEMTPAKLSNQFRQSMAASVEQALYVLAEHSEDDLARGLKTLISLSNSSEIDIEHAVDVLLRLVGRVIYEDKNFVDMVRQTVTALQYPDGDKKKRNIESRIKELHMYYRPGDDIVRTGDIVKVIIEGDNQPGQFTGVVITPACDLARPRTPFLRLVLVHEVQYPNRKPEDKWRLHQDSHLEVCFHEILVIKNLTVAAPDCQKKPVMSYGHSYQTLNGTNVILNRERRLDEPYRADLLHHFASHASRIGLPEF